MATPIYCVNNSVLKSSDMFIMINALNTMLPAFCNAWSVKKYVCIAAPSNVKPKNAMYCVFLDNTDSPGALAYHTEFGNVPYGTVFVKTILSYRGSVFVGNPTISQAFSHEIFEMIVNQNINVWWQQPNGLLVPAEVCDPVQGNIVSVKVGSVVVYLSDYILPEWNDPQSTKGPYNFLNTLKRPFQVAKGGYVIVMRNGNISNVFGESITPYVQYRAENALNYFATHSPEFSRSSVEIMKIDVAAAEPVAVVAEVAVEEVKVTEVVAEVAVEEVKVAEVAVEEVKVAEVVAEVAVEEVKVAEPVAVVEEVKVAEPVVVPVAEVKVAEPVAEVEEVKVAEPVAVVAVEEVKVAEPVAEVAVEEVKVAEPVAVVEEVKVAEPVAEPVAEEVKVAEPVAVEVKVAEPVAEEVKVAEPVAEEVKVPEPVAEVAKAEL